MNLLMETPAVINYQRGFWSHVDIGLQQNGRNAEVGWNSWYKHIYWDFQVAQVLIQRISGAGIVTDAFHKEDKLWGNR